MPIAAGKTELATLIIPSKSFEFYDPADGRLQVLPGTYEVMYGTSSDDKDLKSLKITIK
jgi:beta-glucosidase